MPCSWAAVMPEEPSYLTSLKERWLSPWKSKLRMTEIRNDLRIVKEDSCVTNSPARQIVLRASRISTLNLKQVKVHEIYITRSGAGRRKLNGRFTGCDEGAKGGIWDDAMVEKWLAGGGVCTAWSTICYQFFTERSDMTSNSFLHLLRFLFLSLKNAKSRVC